MDLSYYFADNGPDLSVYTPLVTHNNDMNEFDERVDVLEAGAATLSAQLEAMRSNVGDLTEDDVFKWKDLLNPIIDIGTGFGSELSKHWLDQSGVKEKLLDLVGKGLNDAVGGDEGGVPDPDNTVDVPAVSTDFRKLVRNPWIVERTISYENG